MLGKTLIEVAADARPGWSRLVLSGRVTVAHAKQFHATALELSASGANVTVCCEGADYLDVSAIQILLCLGRELVKSGRRCDIAGVAGALADDFRLAGLGSPPAKP